MSTAIERDLRELAEPFPAEDVEWRVSRSGKSRKGIYCHCLAYITARAIQKRLDDVCGPGNWRNEPLTIHDLGSGSVAMQVGISILIDGQWVTKWDVSEPTADHGKIAAPAKGGFSGAMKRAGAQWGIGRYLYHLDEAFAEVSEEGGRDWNWARLPEKHGGDYYYWKPPRLPAWALPKDEEHEISADELGELKRSWREKFAADSTNPADLREGFTRFVHSLCGEFPLADYTCWTRDAYQKCAARIEETTDADGPSADVPFKGEA